METRLEDAIHLYKQAIANRDAEMIRHWDAEIKRLNGHTTGK